MNEDNYIGLDSWHCILKVDNHYTLMRHNPNIGETGDDEPVARFNSAAGAIRYWESEFEVG